MTYMGKTEDGCLDGIKELPQYSENNIEVQIYVYIYLETEMWN